MNYYLLFDGQKKEELIFDINELGYLDLKKNVFYTNEGYGIVKRLVVINEDKLLKKLKIVSEDGKQKLTLDEFLNFLDTNKVKILNYEHF